MGKVPKYILVGTAVILAAYVGAVTSGFLGFFAVMSLRLVGLLEMRELAIWPDYVILIICVLLGAFFAGRLVWRRFQRKDD